MPLTFTPEEEEKFILDQIKTCQERLDQTKQALADFYETCPQLKKD